MTRLGPKELPVRHHRHCSLPSSGTRHCVSSDEETLTDRPARRRHGTQRSLKATLHPRRDQLLDQPLPVLEPHRTAPHRTAPHQRRSLRSNRPTHTSPRVLPRPRRSIAATRTHPASAAATRRPTGSWSGPQKHRSIPPQARDPRQSRRGTQPAGPRTPASSARGYLTPAEVLATLMSNHCPLLEHAGDRSATGIRSWMHAREVLRG